MFSAISPAIAETPAPKAKKQLKDFGPNCAIIEIEVGKDYRPHNSDSSPCEDLGSLPADLVCRFAAMYNADRHASKNKRWACVGLNGAMFYLRGIQHVDRPADPTAFPPGAQTGLTYDQALEIQERDNSERMKFAKVPLRWTVALRPLFAVEGGAQ